MTDDVFLRTIEEKPDDDATRLIYADWLQERDDEQSALRAAFIRIDCELAALPAKDKRGAKLRKRRRELADRLDTNWLAVVSKLPIERCTFKFECPLRWENLRAVQGSDRERFCEKCEQNVHYCENISEAREHASLGHCVAVDARLVRKKGDLEPIVFGMLLGRVMPPGYRERRRRREDASEE
jgi:uncharacterized protein (TIGR02996 family)